MVLALRPIIPPNRSLRPEGLHPPRGVAPSGLRPLGKILDCSLPRSLGSVSVPVSGDSLSAPVPVLALVSRYLTNKLIGLGPLPERQAPKGPRLSSVAMRLRSVSGISPPFGGLYRSRGQVIQALLTRSPVYSPTKSRVSPTTCMPNPRRQRSL